MSLDPDPEEMRRLGRMAADRVARHLGSLGQRRVARRHTAGELERLVTEALPEEGKGVEDSLEHFFEVILPAATLVHHPRFFAYIPGPGSFVGALGAFVAAATNSFVGSWLGGASMAQLELLVLSWLREAVGLPACFEGILTTGGSMANLGAIAAARTGAGAGDKPVVYVSEEAHYSIPKAARILGLEEVRGVAADPAQRMSAKALAAALAADRRAGYTPMMVAATAGTTNTGAIDPLGPLADLCEEQGLWLHVDAAYGGAVALLERGRELLFGLERADSITLDPHKWLYAPFPCGCLLTRRLPELVRAFAADGDYMQDVPRDEVNFFERGPELSRGNRALKVWMLLRSCGLEAIRDAIAEDLRLCRLARDLLAEDPRIQIVTEPVLSIFTFALEGGEEAGRALIERILADGFLMLSSTRVRGRFVLRFCVVNHRTTEGDLRRAVERIRALI